jgi:hypothetical protein
MMLRSLVLLAALFAQVHATSIAVIVTPKFAVIAADSRVVDAHGVVQSDTYKIRRAGEVFYITSKFVDDSASGYSLDQTVQSAHGTSSADLAGKVKVSINVPLATALKRFRAADLAAFKRNFSSGQAMGVVFIGFENNAPGVVDLRFMIEDLAAAQLTIKVEDHHCPRIGLPRRLCDGFGAGGPQSQI